MSFKYELLATIFSQLCDVRSGSNLIADGGKEELLDFRKIKFTQRKENLKKEKFLPSALLHRALTLQSHQSFDDLKTVFAPS